MYIDKLWIENLRCFEKAEIEFCHPTACEDSGDRLPNVTLLLGNNGAGKSTVLRAVALSILAPIVQSSGLVPRSMVRRQVGPDKVETRLKGRLLLHLQDTSHDETLDHEAAETSMRITRRGDIETFRTDTEDSYLWERMYDDESDAFVMLGYGATRRVEAPENVDIASRKKSRLLRYHRVAGLFEENLTMMPLAGWLPELEQSNPGRFKQIITLIGKLLPEDTKFTGKLEGNEYLFKHRGTTASFGAMSDGFRSYIGWIGDLLYHVLTGCPGGKRLDENRGVVLIDEIGLHLHPEWQRTVIPRLSRSLPRMQFILTSHSPILVGTVHRENLVVFETVDEGASIPRRVDVEIHGLSADQVLTSDAFGLKSSRAPAFVEKMEIVAKKFRKDGDLEAEERFHQMIMHGAAGDKMPTRTQRKDIPPEIIKAARRLREAAKMADEQDRPAGKVTKKKAAKKKTAKKKVIKKKATKKKATKKTAKKKTVKKKTAPRTAAKKKKAKKKTTKKKATKKKTTKKQATKKKATKKKSAKKRATKKRARKK